MSILFGIIAGTIASLFYYVADYSNESRHLAYWVVFFGTAIYFEVKYN